MIPRNFLRLTLIMAWLIFTFNAIAHAEDRSLDRSQFAILGLVIGESTSQDIYSKLGPGIPFHSEAKVNAVQVCYVSDKDDTLILFSLENLKSIGLQLLSQKRTFYKWHFCEKSPMVSKHLVFANGIKLGMSKNMIAAILGTTGIKTDDSLKHVYEWQLKMNPKEMVRASQHSGDDRKNRHGGIKATIRAEFSDTGLISIDVSQSLQ